MRPYFYFIPILILIFFVGFIYFLPTLPMNVLTVPAPILPTHTPLPTPTPTPVPLRSVFLDVPFTSQAPSGQWSDSRFQDACEETSVIMAMAWVRGQPQLSADEATRTIESMALFQSQQYGGFVDTSVQDTVERLFIHYYQYLNVEILPVENYQDVVLQLVLGHIVIVPTNGKMLHNPNFTNGGPDRHNLVIVGYDMEKEQFITNDPGTRNGKGYRYDQQVLLSAIRDYPTGDHEPITSSSKTMISIKKLGSI